MPEGKVKWFNTRKGYGFIASSSGPDIFVHYSNISGDGYRTLNEVDTVNYEIVEGEKGLRAENVIPMQAAESKPDKKASRASQKNEEN